MAIPDEPSARRPLPQWRRGQQPTAITAGPYGSFTAHTPVTAPARSPLTWTAVPRPGTTR